MKILFVTHYFEPDSGAAAVRLSRLARLLKDRGHQVSVITTMPHYPVGKIRDSYQLKLFSKDDHDGVTVYRTWLWATPSSKISRKLISQLTFMVTSVLRGIFLPTPDVLFIEGQPIFTGLAGRVISIFKRRPYIYNVSDLWPDHLLSVGALKETSLIYRVARKLVDSNYRNAANVVAMSNGWAEKLKKYIDSETDLTTVYNGVDLDTFRADLDDKPFRTKYNLGDKKLVSFIGTFATQYDTEAMLDTIAHFADRNDVTFLFIGAGSQRKVIDEELSKRNLTNLKMIDWLPHAEIPVAWSSTTVAFWAMRAEPLYNGTIPAKLFETLATGTPVVAAHGLECRKLVEQSKSGVIVEPGETASLIAALESVLDDDEQRLLYSKNARRFAEQELDANTVADRYDQILQQASKA